MIVGSSPFAEVPPAISTDNKTAAVPSTSAILGSEEESPLTSFITETDRLPAVENENTTQAVEPIALATTGLTGKAELLTAKKVHTSAEKETSHERTATAAWWTGLTLLAVSFLALLGWTIFGREKHHQFEVAPVIEIPTQSNTPWQFQESTDVELIYLAASETDPHEIEKSFDFESDTELLDEIHSINAIAFDSNSTERSDSNSRAKSESN